MTGPLVVVHIKALTTVIFPGIIRLCPFKEPGCVDLGLAYHISISSLCVANHTGI